MHSAVSALSCPNAPSVPRFAQLLALPADNTMAGNGRTSVDGIGNLTYQRAIDIARNTEGELDSNVSAYLDKAITDIWNKITATDTYVLSRDEFAVFNYYIRRFDGNAVAERAIERYWRNTAEQPPPRRR